MGDSSGRLLCPEMNPVAKFTNFTIFRYALAKITNFTDCKFFSCSDAKIAEFTIRSFVEGPPSTSFIFL